MLQPAPICFSATHLSMCFPAISTRTKTSHTRTPVIKSRGKSLRASSHITCLVHLVLGHQKAKFVKLTTFLKLIHLNYRITGRAYAQRPCNCSSVGRQSHIGIFYWALQWLHNKRNGVSIRQPHECLLNRLFRRRSKKTSNLLITGLCEGNPPVTGGSPHQGPITRKMFPFDEVIMTTHSAYGVDYNLHPLKTRGWNKSSAIFTLPALT